MSMTIEQKPAGYIMPAGTDWIYTLSSTNTSGNYKYKFIADLYIDKGTPSTFKIRLKFSPNDSNVGIINISDILQDYVNPDKLAYYDGTIKAEFKTNDASATNEFPVHLIDKFSLAKNSTYRLTIEFGEEYSTTATGAATIHTNEVSSADWLFYNGVAYNNEQVLSSGNYGISLVDWDSNNYIVSGTYGTLLTNAPIDAQYIGDNEYATIAHLNGYLGGPIATATKAEIKIYNSSDVLLDTITNEFLAQNGGYNGSSDSAFTDSQKNIQYIGVGPGNISGATGSWDTTWAYYNVVLIDDSRVEKSKTYKYIKRNADCKGFEKIRLTWLNKFGVWDYYTFTKKSVKQTKISRNYYSSVKGNWNDSTFTKYGGDRGRGVITTKATESISINSDWIYTDEEAAWLEELFISQEVYIINDDDGLFVSVAKYGKYMIPVVITNTDYQRYTRANDKVAQYNINLEYSIDKKVQRA